MSEKEEILNEVLEVGNWYLHESNEKLRNTAMIEKAHKKIKRANADMVLNRKKTKNCAGKGTVNNWHVKRERPVAKKIKSGD